LPAGPIGGIHSWPPIWPLSAELVMAEEHLLLIHRAPFDRGLLVQARPEHLNRPTTDRMLTDSGENGLWNGG
jgi:PIN domain nuclease of toxin-antitoxin system